MKDLYLICFTLASWVLQTTALVHFIQLEKTETGCKMKGNGEELEIGEAVKDPDTCGVIVCQNKDGEALIYYCQIPAAFEGCRTDGVSIQTAWPQCCWMCVDYVVCRAGAPTP